MSIISSLPFTLTNGQTADATQVMSNFNTVVSNVNTNAAENGANSSITSLTGLTTPLAESEGGTGSATGATLVPTGAVIPFAGSAAPTGWLLCYGQAVNRTTYATLFALIGSTYGAGDGSTTFNLPDLRGRAVAGVGNMGGAESGRLNTVIATALGATGGDQNQQAHIHTGTASSSTSLSGSQTFGFFDTNGGGGGPLITSFNAGGTEHDLTGGLGTLAAATTTTIVVNPTGAGAAQNVQPTIELSYIIKT